jgi:LmbE family N-acetylglucosaminyl deacetylase
METMKGKEAMNAREVIRVSEALSGLDAFRARDIMNRNERANVGSSHARLLEIVSAPASDGRRAPPVLICVAHPDDEAVGAGARLARYRNGWLVVATDGAPRNRADAHANGFRARVDYANARRAELFAALRLVGFPAKRVLLLGYVDQDLSQHMVSCARRIAELMRALEPEAVLTHPYEGGHPDHDAMALAVSAATSQVRASCGEAPPTIEMSYYHRGANGMIAGDFLPHAGCENVTRLLDESERRFKRRLYDCYLTQARNLAGVAHDVERFRIAPEYDFRSPPHAGSLHYEHFDWGMRGQRWRMLAAAALEEMGAYGVAHGIERRLSVRGGRA